MSFDPRHPLLVACKQLGAAFDARDAEIATGLGVSRNELRVLNLLEDGPHSHVSIATHLGVSRAAVTSIVDGLADRRLVSRSESPDDRRVKLVSLTPAVWAVLAEHYRPFGERVLAGATALTPTDVEALVLYLGRLVSAIAPNEGGPVDHAATTLSH